MQIVRGLSNLKIKKKGCVVTIGNFDGVHLGHQAIIDKVVSLAKGYNIPSVVMIFEPQPEEYFDKCATRITTLREKIRIFKQHNPDILLLTHFDSNFATLSSEKFVVEILAESLNAKYIVMGDDFRFGKDRLGDFAYLQEMSKKFDFVVEQLDSLQINGKRVSSTRVRELLQLGNFKAAKGLLGYSYCLSGHIAHGDKRGRTIGFPTANIHLRHEQAPLAGVFVVRTYGLALQPLLGIANIGNRPTIGGRRKLLEVHLLDFDQDVYGKLIEVEFLQKLRDEKHYASFALLKQQLEKDEIMAREFFASQII